MNDHESGVSERIRLRPDRTGLLMALSDTVAFLVATVATVLIRYEMGGAFELWWYWRLWPVVPVFLLTFAALGLYPGVLLTPPEELKKSVWGISLVYLTFTLSTFIAKESAIYSRSILLVSWLLTLILVQFGRSFLRRRFAHRPWWGYPVVVLGAGVSGDMLVRNLHLRPRLGLKPVVVLDDDRSKIGSRLDGVPVAGKLSEAPDYGLRHPGAYAAIAIPSLKPAKLRHLLDTLCNSYKKIIIVPDLFGQASMWVSAVDIGGILGLETRQKLVDPARQRIKRVMDLLLTLSGSLVILPFFACIMLAIRLETRGAVFYRQKRIGQGGREIVIWKFRTMVPDADTVLRQHLEEHPELRREWERDHKLRNDPRVTRIGRWLRRTSLDELPQLINVLRGELSLVGPRPIVEEEKRKYDRCYDLYRQVRPGMTGLWQISGRNNLAYDMRIDLDAYYIRNWSVWFDIYILYKTPGVVFQCRGAY